MNRNPKILIGTALLLTVGLMPGFAADPVSIDGETLVLNFEIAEDHKRFVFDADPLFADGAPGYGNEFVTQGYIYLPGTLDGSGGVLPDGSPEFPDRVVGEWSCWGYHVGNGAYSSGEPWVVTTQMYNFGEIFGRNSIISQGYELPDLGEPISRALNGGTGVFRNIGGEMEQRMVGFTDAGGVILEVELRVDAANIDLRKVQQQMK